MIPQSNNSGTSSRTSSSAHPVFCFLRLGVLAIYCRSTLLAGSAEPCRSATRRGPAQRARAPRMMSAASTKPGSCLLGCGSRGKLSPPSSRPVFSMSRSRWEPRRFDRCRLLVLGKPMFGDGA